MKKEAVFTASFVKIKNVKKSEKNLKKLLTSLYKCVILTFVLV